MSDEPINIMAGLKDLSPSKNPGTKMGIVIRSDELWFDPDDKPMAKAIAAACVVQIRMNLEQGQGPNGSPLPGMTRSTLERREKEAALAGRGGIAHPRYHNAEFRHLVQNNYQRDYTAPKLGAFTPFSGGPRGILSGMLSKSFAARPAKDGKGVTVYVAAKRGAPRPGTVRPGETKSALESVFGNVPIWDDSAMHSPKMRGAMEAAAGRMLGKSKSGLRKQAIALLKELGETAELAEGVAEDSEK
jgi:hypothetical protein